MNILIIGSGGREHALYETVKSDSRVKSVFIIGQNGGVTPEDLIINISALDFEDVYKLIKEKEIDLTIVGPEMYLEAGIVDYLRVHKCKVIGPTKFCSQLETSKLFAKKMMDEANVPTAKYKYVTNYEQAMQTVNEFGFPVVLKFDGLAAGKGVLVCESETQAHDFLKQIFMDKYFGTGGVVIEECLEGEEYSVFAFVDGTNYCILPIAQDYKRAFDGDLGPNTGGMGANTTSKFNANVPVIENEIIKPLLNKFSDDGYHYTGFLYIGLMETKNGPKVIEFNVRMGDPETQLVMQKLDEPLIDIFSKVTNGSTYIAKQKENEFVGVVIAANGYPTAYEKNVTIELNEQLKPIYHMGTKFSSNKLISTAGRVFMVTSSAQSVEQASSDVYNKLSSFENEKLFYRKDIGFNRI